VRTYPGATTYPGAATFPGDDGVTITNPLAHLEAVQALLDPLGYPVYFVDVPQVPTYPYVLLWSSAGHMVAEAICDEQADLDDLLGVTFVAGTPAAALVVAAAVRRVLMDSEPDVAGWSSLLRLFDSRPVQVDRDVTNPALNRHPAYGVDIYQYRSTPRAAERV
jgi:hypothetical protein